MESEFRDVTLSIDAHLSYSYAMTCVTIFFLIIVGCLEIIEIRSSLLRLEARLKSEKKLERVEAPEVLRLSRRKKQQVPPIREEFLTDQELVAHEPEDLSDVNVVVGPRHEEIELNPIIT